jgi:hypothetical protein
MQIGREAVKPADGIGVAIGSNGHVMRAVADVDPRGVGVHHLESGIGGLQATGQLSAWLPAQP